LHTADGFAVWNEMLGKRHGALTRLRQAWENNGKDGMFFEFINNSVARSDAEYLRETDRFDHSRLNTTVPLATALLHEVPLTAFAIIKDGEWYERGKMGWWGMISDEKHLGEWSQKVSELLKASDPDMLVSIVDCHI
jgi:alkanesulfonate monooxygenase SsuD/methylene tetrahydromethanopterin reductase-like flavin-dependent oxidoreductase (luciferase family)